MPVGLVSQQRAIEDFYSPRFKTSKERPHDLFGLAYLASFITYRVALALTGA